MPTWTPVKWMSRMSDSALFFNGPYEERNLQSFVFRPLNKAEAYLSGCKDTNGYFAREKSTRGNLNMGNTVGGWSHLVFFVLGLCARVQNKALIPALTLLALFLNKVSNISAF